MKTQIDVVTATDEGPRKEGGEIWRNTFEWTNGGGGEKEAGKEMRRITMSVDESQERRELAFQMSKSVRVGFRAKLKHARLSKRWAEEHSLKGGKQGES